MAEDSEKKQLQYIIITFKNGTQGVYAGHKQVGDDDIENSEVTSIDFADSTKKIDSSPVKEGKRNLKALMEAQKLKEME